MAKTDNSKLHNKPTVLIVMDGFGIPKDVRRSGITAENTQNIQNLCARFPNTKIRASEEYVGLPKGQAGTSEVGHMTIGSGRVTYQPLVRINKEIETGDFYKNKEFLKAIDYAKKNGKKIHLIGIPSDGGIHSHINHLFALLKLCKEQNFEQVFVHFIGDGRDTSPKSAKKYIRMVEKKEKELGIGKIATVVGRFYALDRDKNWDRNKFAYELWTDGKGKQFDNITKAIDNAYEMGETDEFLTPICLMQNGKPVAKIEKGDVVFSYNFRADRERQLAYILAEKNDLDFVKPLNLYVVTMTEYDEHFSCVHVAYKTEVHKNILSEVLSKNGIKQAKIAETEKYAHLTFFFNSGKQDAYECEDRFLIESKKMASYAKCPEMGAERIADKAVEILDKYDFVAINFANCDMVGHSGDKMATRIAVEVVDKCVKRVVDKVLSLGGCGIVTADHGNADIMEELDGTPNTSHTTSIVPLILFGEDYVGEKLRKDGSLADIAPTILKMMNVAIPKDMTGRVLFENK
jgi:2,3-bisphosphoglycerate-independent phosphoglycerate mutase